MTIVRLAEFHATQFREFDELPTLPAADYASVRDALFELQRATQRVLDADARQGRQAVADIAREYPVMQTLVGYLVAEGERDVRADVTEALNELRAVADERLAPHSQVPERLETHRDEVVQLGGRARELLPALQEVAGPAGWQGQAADSYQESSALQGAAWEEFVEILAGSAESLEEAAALHRATFFTCAESLRFAARQLDLLAVEDPGHLFARTRRAIAMVNRATTQLTRDVDSAQRGQGSFELAQRMEEVLRDTEVLTETTWPSDQSDAT